MNTPSIDNLPNTYVQLSGKSIHPLVQETHGVFDEVRDALAHVLGITTDLLPDVGIEAEDMPDLLVELAGRVENGISDAIIALADRWTEAVHPVTA